MTKDTERREGVDETIEWPETVLRDPGYPELAEQKIDLACDAIVFRPPFDPNDF